MRDQHVSMEGAQAFGMEAGSYGPRSSAPIRLLYDGLVLPFAIVNCGWTFRVAGKIGGAANRLRLSGPTAMSVRRLFGCADIAANTIARQMTATYFRNRALIAFARHRGLRHLSKLVDIEETSTSRNPAAARSPAILLTWHLGAVFAIPGAAYQLGQPVLVFRKRRFYKTPANFRVCTTEFRTDEERALMIYQAMRHLADGGIVLVAADGDEGGVISAPCLGRQVKFRQGPFALSRLAGVPLIPTVAKWVPSGRMKVAMYPPLPESRARTGSSDEVLAAASARWLESYLLQHPAELWPSGLEHFLQSPAIGMEQPFTSLTGPA